MLNKAWPSTVFLPQIMCLCFAKFFCHRLHKFPQIFREDLRFARFCQDSANYHRFLRRRLICKDPKSLCESVSDPFESVCHHITVPVTSRKNPCPIRSNPCTITSQCPSRREKSVSNPFKSVYHCITVPITSGKIRVRSVRIRVPLHHSAHQVGKILSGNIP
jgi:hypothetical protein